jgi:alanyl-tRNA synthetase
VQRCFRTTDIENVGDLSHHTFFEMLGNFSVGDYFKAEVIPWSWDFCTKVLGLPPDRLWITIYTDDDEAYEIWHEVVGIPAERILRYGEEEGNYWLSGDVGPCGPCSELHYDFGEQYGCGPDCEPKHDCGRFLEIWNLVFMTFMQHEDGTRTPLAQKNIDTGAGLERVATAVQHVRSTYETDGLRALLDEAAVLGDRRYGDNPEADRAMRAVVDHARAVTFLIGDGVLPSNEERGYVLRRVLRRAVYFGRTLSLPPGFMATMAEQVIDRFRGSYPYLDERRGLVLATIEREEAAYRETLERGLARLDDVIAEVEKDGRTVIPGGRVYWLYETFGVPRELTEEVASRRSLTIDWPGYDRALDAARERSRAGAGGRFEMRQEELAGVFARLAGRGESFTGYDRTASDTHVTGLIQGSALVDRVEEGQEALVVLGETPFYPEGGGQVGDAGQLVADTGRVQVADTRRDTSGVIYHVGRVTAGYLSVNDQVHAEVDPVRRQDAARNHTGTHLLHASLRAMLGSHVHQRGSLVAPDRLRFDYNHTEAPGPDVLAEVRGLVNDKVRADVAVRTREASLEQARAEGVTAIFGEKYGERVRVVEIGGGADRPFSAELCGGTHVHETGEIGGLFIISEGSIGAGLRRIEALTGAGAERWLAEQIRILDGAARLAGGSPAELEQRILALQDELAAERRRAEALQREAGKRQADSLAEQAEHVNGARLVVAEVQAADVDALRAIGDELLQSAGAGLVLLGAVTGDKGSLVVMARGLDGRIDANRLIKEMTGGRGGGRPHMATGGGLAPAKLSEALEHGRRLARGLLAGHG